MTTFDHLRAAERDFLKVAETAGLPEPDEVSYDEAVGEIELIWHEQKLAVIVECGPYCPVEHDHPPDDDRGLDISF